MASTRDMALRSSSTTPPQSCPAHAIGRPRRRLKVEKQPTHKNHHPVLLQELVRNKANVARAARDGDCMPERASPRGGPARMHGYNEKLLVHL